jgi:hypothetical protein
VPERAILPSSGKRLFGNSGPELVMSAPIAKGSIWSPECPTGPYATPNNPDLTLRSCEISGKTMPDPPPKPQSRRYRDCKRFRHDPESYHVDFSGPVRATWRRDGRADQRCAYALDTGRNLARSSEHTGRGSLPHRHRDCATTKSEKLSRAWRYRWRSFTCTRTRRCGCRPLTRARHEA